MKYILMLLVVSHSMKASAQSHELQQLILNVEKLMQFKQILADMKAGYEILTQGYEAVKNISEGNFTLHQNFLDGLLAVSPTVRKYKKIADIISMQVHLTKEYKAAWKRYTSSGLLNENELDHISKVYQRLFNESVQNLDDLSMVLTAGKLRMNDDERLHLIDQIYVDTENKLQFVRVFNNETGVLLIQRTREMNETRSLEKMYGR